MKIFRNLFIIVILHGFGACNHDQKPVYTDSEQPIEVRVEALLKRMTLEEKLMQLQGAGAENDAIELLEDDTSKISPRIKKVRRLGVGWVHMQRGDAKTYAHYANTCQRRMLEESRLKIPVLVVAEALHGLMSDDGTIFPVPLALGATFDTALIKQIYATAALEGRARGTNLVLAPVLDIGRDARWGRQEETYGEDPFLNGMMARAAVVGFQGDEKMIPGDKVAACMKHFAGHGVPESGNYAGPVQADARTMREVHLKPFHMAIERTDVAAVMATYNPVNGLPICVNRELVTNILKRQWGFRGIVFSDGGAIPQLHTIHHVARDSMEAALRAIKAGVDVELGDRFCYKFLADAHSMGLLGDSVINAAVARVLRVKFRLGLFEQPFVDEDKVEQNTHTAEAVALSLKAAEESVILLKNDNGLLPVTPEKYRSVAVIGPMANRWDYGSYTYSSRKSTTPLQAIRQLSGDSIAVRYAMGCRIGEKEHLDFFYQKNEDVVLVSDEENEPLIREAVRAAMKSDVILLFLGEYDYFSGETWPDHFGDKVNLGLLGSQKKLFRAMLGTGKPLAVIQITGGARAYVEPAEKAQALVQCFYLGEQGGKALAGVLFGRVNPGGKLPVSLPRSSGHIPVYYSKLPIARPGYLLDEVSPLFPFGHGLSYTTFSYSNMRLEKDTIGIEESTYFMVDVTNTGAVQGTETVQMYVRDLYAYVTRPVRELKGFARLTLAPGETKTVRFPIGFEQLSYFKNEKFIIEPGDFRIMASGSSAVTEGIILHVHK